MAVSPCDLPLAERLAISKRAMEETKVIADTKILRDIKICAYYNVDERNLVSPRKESPARNGIGILLRP